MSAEWMDIDGNLHVKGDDCPACKRDWRPCHKCGGPVHWSPVYGGIADACERCEPGWESGPLPPHDSCGFVYATEAEARAADVD